ncbi:hypothetical protein [Agrobacterium sp. lyk4-40-TYG-31]|uniref:hypothetical protein n=1 Tax=Agrobacterium sp. lyk4-40-TYG-31 TaxID=3040276 RepID=UPI00254F5A64|nr:hypothetical protein [Agrobacterium sp. lyk4-40-TYG-31]
MSKQLAKKSRMANLIAIAAEEAAHDDEHRARFEKLIGQIKRTLDGTTDPEIIHRQSLNLDFAEVVRIAKTRLRMRKEEFEAAVANLNTDISRVVNDCPAGKDVGDTPEFMLMTAEELRMSYSLMTPYAAADFIANYGANWGYTASEIAVARKELRPFEQARREKMAAEAEKVAAASRAKIDADMRAGTIRRLEYEATNPPVPDYVIREREWSSRTLDPRDYVEVVYQEEEFSTFTPEEIERAKDHEARYLRSSAKNMIRELEKLTEHTFDRRWKTKAELHAALRAHFKACGYDEELDLRWLRFGAYTDPSYH